MPDSTLNPFGLIGQIIHTVGSNQVSVSEEYATQLLHNPDTVGLLYRNPYGRLTSKDDGLLHFEPEEQKPQRGHLFDEGVDPVHQRQQLLDQLRKTYPISYVSNLRRLVAVEAQLAVEELIHCLQPFGKDELTLGLHKDGDGFGWWYADEIQPNPAEQPQ